MPISLLSNWSSISENIKSYIVIILLLETLLIGVFIVLDILLFYIFFESILPPLFVLIGIFGSSNRAHVESPLGGSIILAGIVLKLSLYGILRLILPLLPKAYMYFTPMVYVIGVITIIYASFSTLRTIDIKELIAYSSVSHAAVYLLGVFSNSIQGIEGGIILGLAHGFVSSGLFICAGGNAGTPLSLNFIGEFMSLYGTFERLPLLGIFASSSIILSAGYTIYMFNRIAFAGSFSKFFKFNIPDLSKREFNILLILVTFTVILGIYPVPILDGLHYSVSSLIYYT
ncbi:NADH:ubiquinone reductase (H(+)-translocating) [Handroanthus impetiginosus]|uniref:NADH-ubiquinone oxidoreductase chain 4 n=1 Tax=Handroanthus impetiginosus TaxID=429701 RepID=A0A2G9FVY5_9LAMI|nr:NADH:ubiquinone reductase (H(+)-translocating) [Handroanthus impetiginosus]